jgi:hypothetical protein
MKTVVYQSYRTEDVPDWIARCLAGVRQWTESKGYDYRFVGDEFFDLLPDDYRRRAAARLPVLSDLARLIMARDLLDEGYQRTIWIDADVLIFDPDHFDISIDSDFSFCREIWIQPDGKGGIKAHRNVHNAVSVFKAGNSFLEFYIDACKRIIGQFEDGKGLVNQIVGPKLLSSLHNTMGYPVIDNIGMLSPLVLKDIEQGQGAALDLLVGKTPGPMQAANLCSSMSESVVDGIELSHSMMGQVVEKLLANRGGKLSKKQ